MDHFVQGVLTIEDEAYICEPDIRLANGETIRVLYSDLRTRGETEEENPVSQLLEVNVWYELLLIIQIGLGERKVTYAPALPEGKQLELGLMEIKTAGEVITVKKIVQGIQCSCPGLSLNGVPFFL